MKKTFYTVPTQLVTIEQLRSLTGGDGSKLNPILDTDDEWVVSEEEWTSDEFQEFKAVYPEIAAGFVAKNTEPKIYYLPGDPTNQ